MSELRRPGGADDADKPAVNDQAADKPVERPRVEIRTADMNADWPVDRRAVTKAQRHYIDLVKQNGDEPPGRGTDPVYVRDWATGESLDHKYPHITGAKDRTRPDDPADETGQPARDKDVSRPDDSPSPAGPQEKGFPGLDARAIQDTDDGWGDVLAPATKRARDRTSPTDIPDDAGDRSASMSIPEARNMLAERERSSPKEFGRGEYALDARTIQRTDNAWYDKTELTDTAGSESKVESLLRESGKESDDILEYVHDRVDDVAGMVSPPTHAEIGKIPPPPLMSDPLHGAPHTPGDVAARVLAGAYALTALDRMIRKTIEGRKDQHGGNGDG